MKKQLTVTVYVHPDCDVCEPTLDALEEAQVPYRRVHLHHTAELTTRLRALGITATPVVEVGDLIWCGYRPDLLRWLGRIAAARRDAERKEE